MWGNFIIYIIFNASGLFVHNFGLSLQTELNSLLSLMNENTIVWMTHAGLDRSILHKIISPH